MRASTRDLNLINARSKFEKQFLPKKFKTVRIRKRSYCVMEPCLKDVINILSITVDTLLNFNLNTNAHMEGSTSKSQGKGIERQ